MDCPVIVIRTKFNNEYRFIILDPDNFGLDNFMSEGEFIVFFSFKFVHYDNSVMNNYSKYSAKDVQNHWRSADQCGIIRQFENTDSTKRFLCYCSKLPK